MSERNAPTLEEKHAWRGWRHAWDLDESTVYLNHGSFGPSPRAVQETRRAWSDQLERQPMDFFVRRMETHLQDAAARLGAFLNARPEDLCFVDNATTAMNVVAESVTLQPGDEALFTDHEYGAVMRIWRRRCERSQAQVVVQRLPEPSASDDEIVEAYFAGVTANTRLLVVSHVTSPTALLLPMEAIARRARERRIPLVVDGPHAIALTPLDLRRLDCDFYCASGHKWLCGPFGSGFLYVAPRHQARIAPPIVSWGGSVSGRPARWQDELNWLGTRDPAPFLALPAAIDFLESCGLQAFRRRTQALVRGAAERIAELTGLPPFLPFDSRRDLSMRACPLPDSRDGPPAAGRRDALQNALWEKHRIEVPIVHWHGRRFVRVSCHLYNSQDDIDRLVEALKELLPRFSARST